MMATIEPRLIHLLNDATTPQLPNAVLPPFPAIGSLPVPEHRPPNELETSRQDLQEPLGQDRIRISSVLPMCHQDEDLTSRSLDRETRHESAGGLSSWNAASLPLCLLLTDTTNLESSNSLSKILDDDPEESRHASSKKRNRGLGTKDDFVQLPRPVKKQKAAQKQVMPPIINGLLEPPPDAALFPPISSSSFNEGDAGRVKLLREPTNVPALDRSTGQSIQEMMGTRKRRRATKPRRKWTEEETNQLLLGVHRYGVGKWTTILEDKDFKFNDRIPGDLKDRFRTCCPEELRGMGVRKKATANASASAVLPKSKEPVVDPQPKPKAKTGLLSENILIDSEDDSSEDLSPDISISSDQPSKPRNPRIERKRLQDLVELGISGPFKKSHRRERRAFTDQDDKEILMGLDLYGPSWTKIQRDDRFGLSTRKPTDLRDRVRNRYPSIYQRIEKGLLPLKSFPGSDILEPSVNMTIENSLNPAKSVTLEPHLNASSPRDTLPRWSSMLQGLDLNEIPAPASIVNSGEMGISRLLHSDSPASRAPGRQPSLSRPASPLGTQGRGSQLR